MKVLDQLAVFKPLANIGSGDFEGGMGSILGETHHERIYNNQEYHGQLLSRKETAVSISKSVPKTVDKLIEGYVCLYVSCMHCN